MPDPTTTKPRSGEHWWISIHGRDPEPALFHQFGKTGRWYPCGDEEGWFADPNIKPLKRIRRPR